MTKRVPFSHKRKEAPEWVFSWQKRGESWFPKGFATLFVGAVFVFLVTSVRIRVTPPTPWAAKKASLIQITDSAEGRTLTQLAREGGPFPSRFDPSEWEGTAALQDAAYATTRWSPPAYVPKLRELPDQNSTSIQLSESGEAVLPKRTPPAGPAAAPATITLSPVIRPLSGISNSAIPTELPAFEGAVPEKMAAVPWWRFILRLDAGGSVMDCFSLTETDEFDPSLLESWLRRITFPAAPDQTQRWIALEVGFSNQVAHGTIPR